MNFGYPLLNENAELIIEPALTQPRCVAANSGMNDYGKLSKPTEGYQEQVFCHTMQSTQNGETSATLQNRNLGIALTIKLMSMNYHTSSIGR